VSDLSGVVKLHDRMQFMKQMPPAAVEWTMKLQDVMLRAMAKRITWYQTTDFATTVIPTHPTIRMVLHSSDNSSRTVTIAWRSFSII